MFCIFYQQALKENVTKSMCYNYDDVSEKHTDLHVVSYEDNLFDLVSGFIFSA